MKKQANREAGKHEAAKKLVVAITSSALFDMTESHGVFLNDGLEAYRQYQIENEEIPLYPGEAFSLVKKFLAINSRLSGGARVEVILLSRNSADTGLRVFNSIKHHDLDISRAAFCAGNSPYPYIVPFECDLFLSTDAVDVRQALEQGIAAATLISGGRKGNDDLLLKIAFDGDAVLFSDEAEKIYKSQGLEAFSKNEIAAARKPLPGGPFKDFLAALHTLQVEFDSTDCPIRTALVTARAAPAHERVIRTMRDWDIRIDECLFLGGMPKGRFLEAYGADIFFDDQQGHCTDAHQHVAAGHVPHGIANKE